MQTDFTTWIKMIGRKSKDQSNDNDNNNYVTVKITSKKEERTGCRGTV